MNDWKKIDVDIYESNKHLTKEDLYLKPSNLNKIDFEIPLNQIKKLLSNGNLFESLQFGLKNPPFFANEEIKNEYTKVIFEILQTIRNNNSSLQIIDLIKKLTSNEHDILIKYLYKIMSTNYGIKQGVLMLSWFEKTVEIAGIGSIVRYISDRQTI